MVSQRILELLKMNIGEDRYLTSVELSKELNVSPKTILNRIAQLNSTLPLNTAEIKGIPGKGFELLIQNQHKFDLFMNQFNKEHELLSNRDVRLDEIVSLVLDESELINTDRLERELFISRSQVFSDLKILRKQLESYDITLENTRHEGIKFAGHENNIRKFIVDYTNDGSNGSKLILEKQVIMINRIVIRFFQRLNIEVADFILDNLINHIIVMVHRINTNNILDLESMKSDDDSLLYHYAQALYKDLESVIGPRVYESEVRYLMIHLSGKIFIPSLEKNAVAMHAENLVDGMLERVNDERSVDLTRNQNLRVLLVHHTIPLVHRLEHNLSMRNELLSDIKSKFIAAYDLANVASQVINEYYEIVLDENEIGYYALHFQVAISKKLSKKDTFDILIVCSSGKGTSQLLKHQFLSEFENFINTVETTSLNAMDQLDLKKYDYIFSTIPIRNQGVFVIPHFLDERSIGTINAVFKDETYGLIDILDYFPESLFLSLVKASSKEEIMERMVGKIKEVKDVPTNFMEEVLNREAISSTDLMDGVAFPHPNTPLTDDTFVSVCILETPVQWGKHKVDVVFMASIEKGDMKDLQRFYRVMSKLITNKKYLEKLVKNPSYENFKEIILQID
ncbi:transcription antiterminator [Erysipelothrix urinaevulpis]|uniref:BglG family transcription antiterminator n=1 Tax=Erysipelothrix urinaevulpis TaxID=2683717 RepID=UPI00135B4AD7|nr:PTS sugar transporter subunit IIA [Erysipelothrix urinaevulpis]